MALPGFQRIFFLVVLYLSCPLVVWAAETNKISGPALGLCGEVMAKGGVVIALHPLPNELGRGMTAIVTRGEEGGHPIAIKTMKEGLNLSENDWNNIKRGTELSQMLSAKLGDLSPIVAVRSYDRHGNTATIKMDVVEGTNLRTHLESHFQKEGWTKASVADGLKLISNAAYNLQVLAQNRVLYPDFKAANVMVTTNSSGARITKLIDPECLMDLDPKDGTLIKFPSFVSAESPEIAQMRNQLVLAEAMDFSPAIMRRLGSNVDSSSMVYSLGLMLEYEIIKPYDESIGVEGNRDPALATQIDVLRQTLTKLKGRYPVERPSFTIAGHDFERVISALEKPAIVVQNAP